MAAKHKIQKQKQSTLHKNKKCCILAAADFVL